MAIQRTPPTSAIGSTNLADILERVLDKGIVIAGDIRVSLVNVELLTIQLRLVVCSVDKAKEMGMDWWVNNPVFSRPNQPTPVINNSKMESIVDRLERLEERIVKKK